MRVIDLLNKIANGEEVPKCFKVNNHIWEWNVNSYQNELYGEFAVTGLRYDLSNLNDEIEIIEEDEKDEEIEVYINGEKVDITDIYEPLKQGEYFYKENGKWYVHRLENISILLEEDKTIENIKVKSTFTRNQKKIARKINEIIDFINKGE